MENVKNSEATVKSVNRSLLSRMTRILLLFLLSFGFMYFALTGMLTRIHASGLEAFPAVWQDWAMLAAVIGFFFLIHMGFTGIMHNLNLKLRR